MMKKNVLFRIGLLFMMALWVVGLQTDVAYSQPAQRPFGFVPADSMAFLQKWSVVPLNVEPTGVERGGASVAASSASSVGSVGSAGSVGSVGSVGSAAVVGAFDTAVSQNHTNYAKPKKGSVKYITYDCNVHDSIHMYVPEIEMCAGEEYDIPVYVRSKHRNKMSAWQIEFVFLDPDIAEPVYRSPSTVGANLISVPYVSSFDPGMRGSVATNYILATTDPNMVPNTLIINFFCSLNYLLPTDSSQWLFKMRVKCKKNGVARMECILPDDPDNTKRHGTAFWYGPTCQPIKMTYNNARILPGRSPKVWAMPDTTVCANDKIRLWADGGVKYLWEDVSNVSTPFMPAISEPRVQYPIFQSLEPGIHSYRVQISDTTGCYAYDTVMCTVLNNTLNLELPQDTLVDSNAVANLNAAFWGGYPPYSISWEPDSLVQNPIISGINPKPAANYKNPAWVYNLSEPLSEPQMFIVKISDRYCSYSSVQNVNVKGSSIKASINPFPIIRCAGSTSAETIRLNVLTQGGSGRGISYAWSYENLEPGTKDPIFDNKNKRNPQVTYYSRCSFTVRITDGGAGKMYSITDTMLLKDPVYASVKVVDHNGVGPFCETTKMVFTADAVNAGNNPIYSWMINGKEVVKSEDTLFVNYDIKYGDYVSCALYSNDVCVLNPTVISDSIVPPMEFIDFPSALVSFGSSEPAYIGCGDSVSIKVVYKGMGSGFKVQWFRNDNILVNTHNVTTANPAEGKGEDATAFIRNSYYDTYRALLTEIGKTCIETDSVYSDWINAKLNPTRAIVAGPVRTSVGDGGNVCEGSPFAIYADSVHNLPKNYVLTWYRKTAGGAVQTIGHYSNEYDPSYTAPQGHPLMDVYAADFKNIEDYYRAGFPLYFNQTHGGLTLHATSSDSIYYVIECVSPCYKSGALQTAKSPIMKVNTLPILTTPEISSLRINADNASDICEGSSIELKASRSKDVKGGYHWLVNNVPISNIVYPADSMTFDNVKNFTSFGVCYVATYSCINGSRFSPTKYLVVNNLKQGIKVDMATDTIVCAGDTISVKAQPLSALEDKGKYNVEWAWSLDSLLNNNILSKDPILRIPADSAQFGDKSSGYSVDTAIIGTRTYFVKLSNDNNCVGYDSIKVDVGYSRKPSIRLILDEPFPWCKNDDSKYFKLEGENLGKDPVFGIMAKDGFFELWPKDSIPFNSSWFKSGKYTQGGVITSMRVCGSNEAYSDSVLVSIRDNTISEIRNEVVNVCLGESTALEGLGYNLEEWNQLYEEEGLKEEECYEILSKRYTYKWFANDKPDEILSTGRFLNITPQEGTTYTLTVQDTAKECAAESTSAKVNIAVNTDMNFVFTDVYAGKEVPFSICEFADSVLLSWRVYPNNFSGKSLLGFSAIAKDEMEGRFILYTSKPDTVMQAWFRPGDELMYLYEYDTISCTGEKDLSSSLYLQKGRADVASFKAFSDTSICLGESVQLKLTGALETLWPPTSYDATLPNPPVEWEPVTDLDVVNTYTPVATPSESREYTAWGFNELGCMQASVVRVDVHKQGEMLYLALEPAQTTLCGEDEIKLYIDKKNSSVLSSFDSLIWKQNGVVIQKGGDNLSCKVFDKDSIWVEGYAKSGGCTSSSTAKTEKVHIKLYSKPKLNLTADYVSVCKDSTLNIMAKWSKGGTFTIESLASDLSYKLIDRQEIGDSLCNIKLRALKDFTFVASAFFSEQCQVKDSVKVVVEKNLYTLSLVLQEPDVVCASEQVSVSLLKAENIDRIEWYVNDVLYKEQTAKGAANVLPKRASNEGFGITGMFANKDKINAIGYSLAKCVVSRDITSPPVIVRRATIPEIKWVEPTDYTDLYTVLACNGDSLVLSASVAAPYTMQWFRVNENSVYWNDLPYTASLQASDSVYSLKIPTSAPSFKVFALAYEYDQCANVDSMMVRVTEPKSMSITIKANTSQICMGDEVVFSLEYAANVDSTAWFLNDMYMSSDYTFKCKPSEDDTVYAYAYSFSKCVSNQGLRSNGVVVDVIDVGSETIEAVLTPGVDSVCGPTALTYTLNAKGFDDVYWYANSVLEKSIWLASGESFNFVHTPRAASAGVDSVWAKVVRRNRACAEADTLVSNVVSVYRREAPVVSVSPSDTTVYKGQVFTLTASGASEYLWWPEDDLDATYGNTVTCFPSDTTTIYVLGYEPSFQKEPSISAVIQYCLDMDSIMVYVIDSVKVDDDSNEPVLYIPNAVMPLAEKWQDRIFKVYGPDIASVKMQVFSPSGSIVFEADEAEPIWEPLSSMPSGNYAYRVWVRYASGEVVQKQSWVSLIK